VGRDPNEVSDGESHFEINVREDDKTQTSGKTEIAQNKTSEKTEIAKEYEHV
jgi:hypothetical protein